MYAVHGATFVRLSNGVHVMRHDVLILPSPRANRYHVDYWITHVHEVLCGTRCSAL